MRYWLIILLFLTFSTQAQNRCCIPLEGSLSVEQLGYEFQRLKTLRETEYCRNNLSRMMEILYRLQDSLSKNVTSRQVKNIMGQPDFIKMPNELSMKLSAGETIIGYNWRTTDFLYFIFKNGRLINNNWYHSFE